MTLPLPVLLRRFTGLLLAGCLALPVLGQAPQPQEIQEFQAAASLKDPVARLKELERIKEARPGSPLAATLDSQILATRTQLVVTLDEVVGLQKQAQAAVKGPQTFFNLTLFPDQIMDHSKAAGFDKAKVLAAVKAYRDQAWKLAADPEFTRSLPPATREYLPSVAAGMDVSLARAQVMAGQPAEAMATLEAFQKAGGPASPSYSLVLADALEAQGRAKEAFEALVAAAVENHPVGTRRARAAYAKLNGKEEGFDALLEAKSRELPFHPQPVKPGPAWKGKAVLAELFTGSECPPCVAADFAFDGLLEAFPSTTLVVLEYHLPIPRPDPMMNPATKVRQDYYGVNSTPTMLLDGQDKQTGGGGRGAAAGKFQQLATKVKSLMDAAPGVTLGLKATRKGDAVAAAVEVGTLPEGVDLHLALVQAQQEHKGGNKLSVHKMVVRDFATLAPGAKSHAFDLAASEKATDAYLTDFEKTSTRFKGFTFPVRRSAIGRDGLKLVLFAQERATRKVLQAVLADAK